MEKELDFESGLKKLDEILSKMQKTDISLDENLKLYNEGINLIKKLENILEDSKEKIENVVSIKEK